jgi:hypothetical protein
MAKTKQPTPSHDPKKTGQLHSNSIRRSWDQQPKTGIPGFGPYPQVPVQNQSDPQNYRDPSDES